MKYILKCREGFFLRSLPRCHSKQTTPVWHTHTLSARKWKAKIPVLCWIKETLPSAEGRSLTCGVAPGRCRCRFASSPCAVSCRAWPPCAQGSPEPLPWGPAGLGGSWELLPGQEARRQPNVVKQRAASAAGAEHHRPVLQPGERETTAGWQCLKAAAHGSRTSAAHTPHRGGKQSSKVQPLIPSWISLVVAEEHPCECRPRAPHGPLWMVFPTLCRCWWCFCFPCLRQGSCSGKARWFVFWPLVTEKHAMTFSSNFNGGASPDTLSMVSTNTASLSAPLWCWAWLPG